MDPIFDLLDLLAGILADITPLWNEAPNDTVGMFITSAFLG